MDFHRLLIAMITGSVVVYGMIIHCNEVLISFRRIMLCNLKLYKLLCTKMLNTFMLPCNISLNLNHSFLTSFKINKIISFVLRV